MKNSPISILAWACLVLAAFLCGLYLGRNVSGPTIQISALSTPATVASSGTVPSSQTVSSSSTQEDGKININTADIYALMSLPGIGETYAQRIIDYRTANGPFEHISDIKNVDGIGDKRYEAIKNLITTGG